MSDAPPPIVLTYLGQGRFEGSSAHWKALADRHFGEGEVIRMERHEQVSGASRGHYFASLKDAWANLPAEEMARFPSSEHFRKYLLVKTGWCNSQTFVMADHDQANNLRRLLRAQDEYAAVIVKDNIIQHFTAKSQSLKAMGKHDFQKSKDEVLGAAAEFIGTTKKALEDNSGKSGEGSR